MKEHCESQKGKKGISAIYNALDSHELLTASITRLRKHLTYASVILQPDASSEMKEVANNLLNEGNLNMVYYDVLDPSSGLEISKERTAAIYHLQMNGAEFYELHDLEEDVSVTKDINQVPSDLCVCIYRMLEEL
jgi:hypothetical protein